MIKNNDDDEDDDDDDNGDKTAFLLGCQRVPQEALTHTSHSQRNNVTKEFFNHFLQGQAQLSIYVEAKIKNNCSYWFT